MRQAGGVQAPAPCDKRWSETVAVAVAPIPGGARAARHFALGGHGLLGRVALRNRDGEVNELERGRRRALARTSK